MITVAIVLAAIILIAFITALVVLRREQRIHNPTSHGQRRKRHNQLVRMTSGSAFRLLGRTYTVDAVVAYGEEHPYRRFILNGGAHWLDLPMFYGSGQGIWFATRADYRGRVPSNDTNYDPHTIELDGRRYGFDRQALLAFYDRLENYPASASQTLEAVTYTGQPDPMFRLVFERLGDNIPVVSQIEQVDLTELAVVNTR